MKKGQGAIVLLLAGGKGIRIQSKRPKQFIEMEGESILLHTMKAFERHPLVDEIWVVCNPEWSEYVQKQAALGHVAKFRQTLPSGPTSFDSIVSGIRGLERKGTEPERVVIVHESVRPFVSHEVITGNVLSCQEHGNAVTATRSHESYLQTTDGARSSQTYISRELLMRAQTPITFRLGALSEIVRQAGERGIDQSQSLFTLVNEIGWTPLHIVEGSMLNFKITLPQDVEVYSRLRTMNFD